MKKESKYITVLDFEISRVFQYKVNELDLDVPWVDEACEDYLTNKGHNLTNCEWMVHDDNELITNYMQVVTN